MKRSQVTLFMSTLIMLWWQCLTPDFLNKLQMNACLSDFIVHFRCFERTLVFLLDVLREQLSKHLKVRSGSLRAVGVQLWNARKRLLNPT